MVSNSPALVAVDYLSRGWQSIPVPLKQKGPVLKQWQNLRISQSDVPQYFAVRCNIGVLLGEPSGWLIDIDLDHPLAVELAPKFLPSTGRIFGRRGNPRSHWLYRVNGPVSTYKRQNAAIEGDHRTIIELRSTGCQTVFPGSIHESGEEIFWDEEGEPQEIDPVTLTRAVDALADEVERRLGLRPFDDVPDDIEPPDTTAWEVASFQGTGNLEGFTITEEELKPGADFNERGDVRKILERNSWTLVRKEADGVERWRRPGKSTGISGSLKGKAFYCFTSSSAIPDSQTTKKGYSPFAVYAYLEHFGDFSAAAKSLAQQGYGRQSTSQANHQSEGAKNGGVSPKPPKTSGNEGFRLQRHTKKEETPWIPFPTEVLPEPVQSFVWEGAKAIGCDESFIALPALTVLAGAVGLRRSIRLKRDWKEPCVIWSAVVADSGSMKTPAFSLVLRPLIERQQKALDRWELEMEDYNKQRAQYEPDYAEWKKKPNTGDPPEEPQQPHAARCLVSDATIEAMAPILLANRMGLLLARDELNGWLAAFDQYKSKGKGGSDAANWLSMFNAQNVLVDRKTGVPKVISIPRAAVSVTGGIQPTILQRAMGVEYRESGFLARLLLACPPRREKQWTEDEIRQDTEDNFRSVLDSLYEMHPNYDDQGQPYSADCYLSDEAKDAWITFYNSHAQEQAALTGDLAAAWSKLEAYAARFALIVHLVRVVANDPNIRSEHTIDVESINAGVTLARWFGNEAKRVYATFGETEESREQRRIIDLITRKGGRITPNELNHASRTFQGDVNEAEMFLQSLVNQELGKWEPTPAGTGGRPTRRFVLSSTVTVTKTP